MEAVFYNARVYTLSKSAPRAEAIATSGGRIVAVGSSRSLLELASPSAKHIDLKGRVVIPAFTDAHAHFLSYAEKAAWIDLVGTLSRDEVLRRVSRQAKERQAGWILGRGWDQNDWPQPRYPTRKELDDISEQIPIYLVRVCGHAAWVNTKALRLAGIGDGTPDPKGGKILRDETGEPTGILMDSAMDLVARLIPPLRSEEKKILLRKAAQRCHAVGLVGVHEMGISAEDAKLYEELYRERALPFRIVAYLDGMDTANELFRTGGLDRNAQGEMFSIVGAKFYADGSLGARSAALFDDYFDDPGNRGITIYSTDSLYEAILPWHKMGFQLAVHAIGDAAVHMVLDAYERVLRESPSSDARHRIEHAQVVSAADVPRFAAMGVVPSMQFTHCTSDMPWVLSRLGGDRTRNAYIWRSLIASGARIPGGSDFPVESIEPLLGIYAAATRQDLRGNPPKGWHPEECLTVEEAVRAFTVEAAWVARRENLAGSIEQGKFADFIILSDDIFTVPVFSIPQIEVLATVLGGEIVYTSRNFEQ